MGLVQQRNWSSESKTSGPTQLDRDMCSTTKRHSTTFQFSSRHPQWATWPHTVRCSIQPAARRLSNRTVPTQFSKRWLFHFVRISHALPRRTPYARILPEDLGERIQRQEHSITPAFAVRR